MLESEWKEKLLKEGFKNVYVWHDAPGVSYEKHTHEFLAAHIVLEGGMEISIEGNKIILRPGNRFDVPAATSHSAQVGPEGCTYVIGQKWEENAPAQ